MCYVVVKVFNRFKELGVVKGSKTGPMFFDINSSDVARMCSEDKSILYADDSVLVCVGTTLEELTDLVYSRLQTILD